MSQVSIIGNITSPAELRFTQGGKAVASVTVAVNRKRGDKEETDFHRVTVWEGMAENVARLEKGTRVVVVGRLTSSKYQTKEGDERVGWDITADAFGPDLRFASAAVTRSERRDAPVPAQADSWGSAPAAGSSYDPELPF